MSRLYKYVKRKTTKMTRPEKVSSKVEALLKEIYILDFSNDEIAVIILTMRDKALAELERRREALDHEKTLTEYAITLLT